MQPKLYFYYSYFVHNEDKSALAGMFYIRMKVTGLNRHFMGSLLSKEDATAPKSKSDRAIHHARYSTHE